VNIERHGRMAERLWRQTVNLLFSKLAGSNPASPIIK
jgi:hypothetical protein